MTSSRRAHPGYPSARGTPPIPRRPRPPSLDPRAIQKSRLMAHQALVHDPRRRKVVDNRAISGVDARQPRLLNGPALDPTPLDELPDLRSTMKKGHRTPPPRPRSVLHQPRTTSMAADIETLDTLPSAAIRTSEGGPGLSAGARPSRFRRRRRVAFARHLVADALPPPQHPSLRARRPPR